MMLRTRFIDVTNRALKSLIQRLLKTTTLIDTMMLRTRFTDVTNRALKSLIKRI